jgi:hypothetical protein
MGAPRTLTQVSLTLWQRFLEFSKRVCTNAPETSKGHAARHAAPRMLKQRTCVATNVAGSPSVPIVKNVVTGGTTRWRRHLRLFLEFPHPAHLAVQNPPGTLPPYARQGDQQVASAPTAASQHAEKHAKEPSGLAKKCVRKIPCALKAVAQAPGLLTREGEPSAHD